MKRVKRAIHHTLWLALFLPTLFSCGETRTDVPTMERPSSIPSNALWIGGIDGGVYILVRKMKEDPPFIYDAKIYFRNGDIDYQGKLSITPKKNPFFEFNDSRSYRGWDGDTLYLSQNRALIIVEQ